jgi:hypothetical protein
MKKFGIQVVPVILFFSIFSNHSSGQTIINSNIFNSTSWTVAGSPYIVSSNLIVFELATLTIDPGVTVKVNDNLGIEIRGKLFAVGNASDSITFTSSSLTPVMGIWKGLVFSGTTNPTGAGDQATLDYCNGMYAQTFSDLDLAYHGPYRFDHCFFYKNGKVNYDGGLPKTNFSHCVFFENNTGLSYVQFGGTASHCIFINNINGVDGFENIDSSYFSGNTGVALSPYGTAKYCLVENNNIGVRCLFNAVNNNFTNNYVSDNTTGIEMQSFFNGSIQFIHNTICNNTLFNVNYTWPNNADLSNNCWCTTDSAIIRSKIYDGYSPGSVSGLINFMPVAGNCDRPSLYTLKVCPAVNNTTIRSVIPGNTHQWQVNNGNGFVTITDNVYYSGSNSGSLQMMNIPSTWYGYQYQCLVNGYIKTPPVMIRFTSEWAGTVDASWEDPSNWVCNTLPDEHTDVTINSGNVILNSNTTCRSIQLNAGSSYKVNPGYNLTIIH